MGWLDVLIGGVGTGIGGVGQAVAGAREKRLEEERQAKDRALREADLTERRRQFDEGRFTPVETILPFLPEAVRVRMQAAAPGGKVPTAIVPSFLQDLREQAKQARETEQVRGLSEELEGQATTMPSPERAETEPASVDPRMLSLARLVRNMPLGEASKIVAEQVKPEEPMSVAPGSRLLGKRTGRLIGEGAAAEPKTTQETRSIGGQQYRITYNQAGQELGRVPLGPADLNQGQRNEARAGEVLKARGIKEGTPEWDEGMYILTNPTPTVPDVGIFSRLDVLGRKPPPTSTGPGAGGPAGQAGPTPRIPAPAKPVPGETTMQIIGVGRLQDAVKKIDAALADPEAKPYFGPYAQYYALVQEKAPFGLAGKVPDSVIDLNQNIATVQNYTIRLITGAQMNKDEELRIKKELPHLGQPEYMFRRYWSTTRGNIAMLEKRVVGLALSGNQQAKAIAMELGLMPKDSGGKVDKRPEGQERLGRANEEAHRRYGKPFGSLDEKTARALWNELYGGR